MEHRVQTSAGTVAAWVEGEGRPIVLAHGWPWSSAAWHRAVPRLATRFRVRRYDMPGFGRSQMDGPRPASLDVQGDVFGEMLDLWDLPAPRVVAHDFGGAVTLPAHLLQGCDFDRLILMNVVALRPWGSDLFEHVKAHGTAFAGLPPPIHTAIVRAYIASALAHLLDPDDSGRLYAPWLNAEGQAAFWRQFALADEALTKAFEPLLNALRCPVAVLWGADDPWIPVARGHALAARLDVPLEPLHGLGHLPQLEDPARVTDSLLAHQED